MYRSLVALGIILLGLISGCSKTTNKNSPQSTLSEYVARTFAIKSSSDKLQLTELTTGQVRELLEKVTDDEFKNNFLEHKKQFVSLKIRDERKVGDDKYSITYELTYKEGSTPDSSGTVTTKKHALFHKEGDRWLIAEVRNIKTFIEHQNEMSISP
jgi:hypothetical protein